MTWSDSSLLPATDKAESDWSLHSLVLGKTIAVNEAVWQTSSNHQFSPENALVICAIFCFYVYAVYALLKCPC